jgi:hypothetical protein
MTHIRRIPRSLAGLAGLAGVLFACGTATPAALATPPPRPPGWNKHPPLPPVHVHAHTAVTSGMPSWQITLIAAAAVLLAAALAVIAARIRAAHAIARGSLERTSS